MPRSLLRFEQIHLIGFGNAMQAAGPVRLCQRQETMAPAKAGVAVNMDVFGCLAHGKRCEQAAGIRQPLCLMVQVRQRRARQGIEGPAAAHAAIALQAVGMTVPMNMPGTAGRTMQAGLRRLLDQGDGGILRRTVLQQGDAGQALALRQLRQLRDEGLPLDWVHDRLLKGNS